MYLYVHLTRYRPAVNIMSLRYSVGEEYCWDTFNPDCPDGEVILMESARYGRMSLGNCLSRDYHIGCYADVLPFMNRMCSNRQSCHVDIPNIELQDSTSCPKDLVGYLDATYSCVKSRTFLLDMHVKYQYSVCVIKLPTYMYPHSMLTHTHVLSQIYQYSNDAYISECNVLSQSWCMYIFYSYQTELESKFKSNYVVLILNWMRSASHIHLCHYSHINISNYKVYQWRNDTEYIGSNYYNRRTTVTFGESINRSDGH